jgi:hypothetical protein
MATNPKSFESRSGKIDALVEEAKTRGKIDGSQGLPMSAFYVQKGDILPSAKAQKETYVEAYVEARESRGSSRRKTRKSKTTKRKAARRKTRGRK